MSAMVFMSDSHRAANLAKELEIDVGLHLNLSQRFIVRNGNKLLEKYHNQIVHFLTLNKYAFLFYNPTLRKQFYYVYQAQLEEFIRLYGKPPSHIDGHHHLHLCTNMLLDVIIPEHGKVRRNFSFRPGEKSCLNRAYRHLVDIWLGKRYFLCNYLFALSHCLQNRNMSRVAELSNSATVELITHPVNEKEYAYLMSDDYLVMFCKPKKGTYKLL